MSVPTLASYAYPVRALQRWTREHLRLARRPDGGVEASFQLEGSTCGNVPMAMLYFARLGPEEEGWPIHQLWVEPAPHDDGHKAQCAYRANGSQLLAELQSEQPCLGQSLAAALQWNPTTSPAGCLCVEPSRAHKWRIVFHTLHFALHPSTPPLAKPTSP